MEEDTEVTTEETAVLEPLVGFYSPRFNLQVEVTHPKEMITDPTAQHYEGLKVAKFVDGFYSTDDPEIIEALDKRPDVFRMGDPRVLAYEETAGLEPEEREQALRVLERVSGIGGFEKGRANAPGIVPAPSR